MFPNYGDNEFIEKTRKYLAIIVDTAMDLGKFQAMYEFNPNSEDMKKVNDTGRDIGRMSENLLVNIAYELSQVVGTLEVTEPEKEDREIVKSTIGKVEFLLNFCPVCGSRDVQIRSSSPSSHYVHCHNCEVRVGGKSLSEAADRWNKLR